MKRPNAAQVRAIVCSVAGGAMLLVAASLTWNGVQRWLAVEQLHEHDRLLLAGNANGAREAGRAAFDHEVSPATALAAADLASPAAGPALIAAARGAAPNARAALAAAVALAQGQPAEGLDPDTSDLALLTAIKAGKPGGVALDRDHPPHLAVLAAWGVARLRAAWAAGSRSDIVAAASLLLTIAPHHPQAAELNVLLAALGSEAPDKGAFITLAAAISDTGRRQALGRRLAPLVPDRPIVQVLNAGGAVETSADPLLAGLAASAIAAPETLHEGLLIRSLQVGDYALAKRLVATQSGARREALTTLIGLAGEDSWPSGTKAIVTAPLVVGDLMAFHLSNAAGGLPRSAPLVTISTVPVAANEVRRLGTLVLVPWRASGEQLVEIRYQDAVVYSGTVHL